MPSYVFTKDSTTISRDKKRRVISAICSAAEVFPLVLSPLEAVAKAEEYLSMLGINHITDTYYEINGNVCLVNFAGT